VSTPEELTAALEEGGSLQLNGDVTIPSRLTFTTDTEIDLNGHSITASGFSPMINANGAKLTLKGNGSIQNNKRIGVASNGGEIVIENGNYVSTSDVAFEAQSGGKVTFNGGNISSVEGGIIAPSGNGSIEVNGGHIEASDNFAIATNGSSGRGGNTIMINGGTFEGNIHSSGYEAVGIYIANSDTFIMNGGEIIAHGGTGTCMRGGNVTINNGKVTASNVDKNGNTVADGWIGDKKTVMTGCSAIIYHESANYPGKAGMKLTINGGTITGVDHSVQVLSNEETPQVFVTGGTLTPAYPEVAAP
jgi:hypothetical protein